MSPMDGTHTLYRESLIWDDHCGFTATVDGPLDPLLQPWREARVDYLSVNVYYDLQPWTEAARIIAAFRSRLPEEAPYCRLVSTVDEVNRAKVEGKLAIAFDIEGMNALNGQLEMVQRYYELGVRQMAIAYNRNNLAGSGCHDEDTGLTGFGRQVVEEMNQVGMVIDCSHTGYRTTMAIMERSTHPVIFSHSNPRSLVEHGRNVTDEQIKECANTGGVVGISGVNLFLGEEEATPTAVAQHAEYVAQLTSPEHVGISLDFDPEEERQYQENASNTLMEERDDTYWPKGTGYGRPAQTLSVSRLPDVVNALEDVGFDSDDIGAILGGNFRRVAKQVWK